MWERYIQQNPETPARTIEGAAIVITPHDSKMHSLNETATFIWDRADGTRRLCEIADELRAEFEVDAARAREDALTFAEAAVNKGMLFAHDEPAPNP